MTAGSKVRDLCHARPPGPEVVVLMPAHVGAKVLDSRYNRMCKYVIL